MIQVAKKKFLAIDEIAVWVLPAKEKRYGFSNNRTRELATKLYIVE